MKHKNNSHNNHYMRLRRRTHRLESAIEDMPTPLEDVLEQEDEIKDEYLREMATHKLTNTTQGR